ncbi:hypothetical protein ARMSODRAFT_1011639 [Armillaria solidipes]|uniref:Heterokaryon incompatibility domain-containing protein n=1 Tax=Armillaria solidipes TaxID=1076256 RepID=A0A2H3CHY3_9AGAR|nr:hypothetical protein ARMSODRAFT_1011639 [Armillaria solidipes]
MPPDKHFFAWYSLHLLSQEIVVFQSLCNGVMKGWDNEEVNESDDDGPVEYLSLPEVTISAFIETGQEESSIIVPLQRAYTGRKPVISSRLADTPCATLGVQGLLDKLNTTLRTSYSLDNQSLSSLLEDCITKNYDFGMAYGRLRVIWYTDKWSTIRDVLCRREKKDRDKRREALIDHRIVDTWLRPRRVWDLCSNRVVPYWIKNIDSKLKYRPWPQPISHAWVDERDRAVMRTPINGYEWPVPIPNDVDLNLIRIEMLNLGLEYAWLDVLCLRQVGGPGEDLRADEWKVDVPTIGRVYYHAKVVCYLSGLGRPLTLKDGDLESEHCWFRRAWTLQEVGYKRVIAGDTPDGPLHAEHKDGKYDTELLTRFHKQLQSKRSMWLWVHEALEEMRKRVSTNPVDKIAGLAFLMYSRAIPAYYESESLEDAWTALVLSMDERRRAQLFFLCPEPGNAGKKWRPSWDQVMKPLHTCYHRRNGMRIRRDKTVDEDWCVVDCIEKGLVRGLAVVEGGDPSRRGELIVENDDGIEQFKITAAHAYPIPEDTYTMIHTCEFESSRGHGWVVGRSLPGGKFEKVATLEISHEEQSRLEDLHITEERQYILI